MLRGGHVQVSGPHHDIARRNGADPERQSRDRVGSARDQDAVGTGYCRRRQCDWGRPGARDPHGSHTGRPRGDHGHEHRGGQGIAAARRVAPRGLDRIDTVAGSPTGYRSVQRGERPQLRLGEGSDSLADPLEAVPLVFGELIQTALQSLPGQIEGCVGCTVLETGGVFSQRLLAAGAYGLHDDRGLLKNFWRHPTAVPGSKLLDAATREKRLAHGFFPSSDLAWSD